MTSPPGTSASRARPSSVLEQHVEIETPEQVAFSYTVAGIGSRAAAAVLDVLIVGAVMLVLFLMLVLLWSSLGLSGFGTPAGGWAVAALILGQFVLFWGYFVGFETWWDGQTPGKRKLGIRVVQDGGYSVSFAASAIRNVLRILDMQPGIFYAVAVLSATFSRKGKRLGDVLAGTMVVQERLLPAAPAASIESGEEAHATAQLTDEEYGLLERFLARRADLDPERRRQLVAQLSDRFAHRVPDLPDASAAARLIRLFERERSARARGAAGRGETGAARERHAIVAQGASRWRDFAELLSRAQRTGLRAMPEEEVSRFVAEYREVSTDLARLRTASRGGDQSALFHVSRLVGAGHNLLYRQRVVALGALWRFVAYSVPREIRRAGLPIAIATLALFGPMTVSTIAVMRNPEVEAMVTPATLIDRAERAVEREKLGGYGYIDAAATDLPVIASRVMTNNVQVSFLAFAGGMAAGALTLLVLVTNGIVLGGGMGSYAARGVGHVIFDFVIAHGVLELMAICLAGGAGLLVGSAIVLPGALTRREALVLRGRRALHLVVAATLFLIGAGIIEGLISPRVDIPTEVKVAVGVATGLIAIFYVSRGRGAHDEPELERHGYSVARALISR